ncbi:hypothetical protein C8J56DRAFT_1166239 [Mycena floridula]|nr:hypothetical protein C8J56DRAFT_1166239 [Mycena floridula]
MLPRRRFMERELLNEGDLTRFGFMAFELCHGPPSNLKSNLFCSPSTSPCNHGSLGTGSLGEDLSVLGIAQQKSCVPDGMVLVSHLDLEPQLHRINSILFLSFPFGNQEFQPWKEKNEMNASRARTLADAVFGKSKASFHIGNCGTGSPLLVPPPAVLKHSLDFLPAPAVTTSLLAFCTADVGVELYAQFMCTATFVSFIPGLLDLASPIAANAVFSLTAIALDLSYIKYPDILKKGVSESPGGDGPFYMGDG